MIAGIVILDNKDLDYDDNEKGVKNLNLLRNCRDGK